jgi:hypothetical protein
VSRRQSQNRFEPWPKRFAKSVLTQVREPRRTSTCCTRARQRFEEELLKPSAPKGCATFEGINRAALCLKRLNQVF